MGNTQAVTLEELNRMELAEGVERFGGFFENSPWVVETALRRRPFSSLEEFHQACMEAIREAGEQAKVELIRAHPDLVGRLAQEGRLGLESAAEQASAGLDNLSREEVAYFDRYNAAYRERFGFPFVICARKNRKEAILEAFPNRLAQDREAEIETALGEIGEIAWLRMTDLISR
ncbi:MAG: 2-oxo-4-hydroxy-4-carboxy-5-ureidoimidazoline decarboxylase [Alkalispirochaetaceae bacterium]